MVRMEHEFMWFGSVCRRPSTLTEGRVCRRIRPTARCPKHGEPPVVATASQKPGALHPQQSLPVEARPSPVMWLPHPRMAWSLCTACSAVTAQRSRLTPSTCMQEEFSVWRSESPSAYSLLRDASANLRFDDRLRAVYATRQLLLWMQPRPAALDVPKAHQLPDRLELLAVFNSLARPEVAQQWDMLFRLSGLMQGRGVAPPTWSEIAAAQAVVFRSGMNMRHPRWIAHLGRQLVVHCPRAAFEFSGQVVPP